jgi:hypothetical protein
MSQIFIVTDPEGYQITLDSDAWEHIVDGHPDMAHWQSAVRATLERPEIITERTSLARYYYSRRSDMPMPEHHLLVVVTRTKSKPFRVVTAHVCSDIEGDRVTWTQIPGSK